MFGNVVDRKQMFLDSRNINFRQSPNWIFPKGLALEKLELLAK